MRHLTSVHDIKSLVLSYTPVLVIETVEEERVATLLESTSAQTRMPLLEWSLTTGLIPAEDRGKVNRTTAPPAKLMAHMDGITADALFFLKDFGPQLKDAAIARYFRELCQKFAKSRKTIILTGDDIELPSEIEPIAVRLDLKLPGEDELLEVVQSVADSFQQQGRGVVSLTQEEWQEIARTLQGMTLNQARQTVAHAILVDGKLSPADIPRILDRKVQSLQEGGLLEYFPVKDNKYEIGGFQNLKEWLDRARLGFTEEARDLNLEAPKGILLVGVQGCGKSLAAKFVARSWKMPLLKLDAGRLFDKYIGESEKNFRKAIAMAESMAPTVLWIDEIEKALATGGGDGESDAGLSKRLFGAFLTWMQEKKKEVFVVGTANDIFHLPPELLRKGRFDEIFFVNLPTAEDRKTILEIHLKLRNQDPGTFDLDTISKACEGFSGAEIEQAVIGGLYRALHRGESLGTSLLIKEIENTVPLSVSRREEIMKLQALAKDRFVPVG